MRESGRGGVVVVLTRFYVPGEFGGTVVGSVDIDGPEMVHALRRVEFRRVVLADASRGDENVNSPGMGGCNIGKGGGYV